MTLLTLILITTEVRLLKVNQICIIYVNSLLYNYLECTKQAFYVHKSLRVA